MMMKVKIFQFEIGEVNEDYINEFCEGKDIVDIKITHAESYNYYYLFYTILYKE